MHARPNLGIQPGLAILGAENDMKDEVAEGLGHKRGKVNPPLASESRFQGCQYGGDIILGRCPRLS